MMAVFWIMAVVLGLVVCARCLKDGEFIEAQRSRKHDVKPLRWSLMVLQPISLVIGMIPYAMYKFARSGLSAAAARFFVKTAIPSAVILLLVIIAELVLMYLQANRSYTDMARKSSDMHDV
ncbi:hypothetical protein [Bifidobacterium bombi]|nr:hypothetical protein [Bifidobacterium bombi]